MKVTFNDVEHIGHQLRLSLHENHFPFNDLDSLFDDYDDISIRQLKVLLAR